MLGVFVDGPAVVVVVVDVDVDVGVEVVVDNAAVILVKVIALCPY